MEIPGKFTKDLRHRRTDRPASEDPEPGRDYVSGKHDQFQGNKSVSCAKDGSAAEVPVLPCEDCVRGHACH